MEIQSNLLFVMASISSILGLFVLLGKRNSTNIIYFMFVIFASLWSIGLGFFIMEQDLVASLYIADFYYVVAAGIPLFFLYFSIFFPDSSSKIRKRSLILFALPMIILIALVIIDKNILVKNILFGELGKYIVLNQLNYAIYGSYIVLYTIISFYNLVISYLKNKLIGRNEERMQVMFVIIGTSISFIAAIVFDVIFPLFGDFKYVYLAPLFSFFMVLTTAYSLMKQRLFNLKVVATEIPTFVLWFAMFVRILMSENIQDRVINGAFLVFAVIIGLFIIQSVIKEVEQREKIEKLAKDLYIANEKLKDLDRLKSELLSLATHQMRAPLTSIKGYTSMILEGDYGEISDRVKAAIKTIFDSCQSLVIIVGEFLDISRIEQGRMKYNVTDFDMKKVVSSVINEFKPTIENAHLTIDFVKDDNKEHLVHADVGKVKQILENIMDNSIKYTPIGGVTIVLTENWESVQVAISDTGIGISEEDISKLFSKFSRIKDANKINVIGTGLGLYVAKQMIEAQGGKVWAESEGSGKGSTFFVEFPKKV